MLQYRDTVKHRALFFSESHRFKSKISIIHIFEAVYMTMNKQRCDKRERKVKTSIDYFNSSTKTTVNIHFKGQWFKWGIDALEINTDSAYEQKTHRDLPASASEELRLIVCAWLRLYLQRHQNEGRNNNKFDKRNLKSVV